jgi:hypothetical protein
VSDVLLRFPNSRFVALDEVGPPTRGLAGVAGRFDGAQLPNELGANQSEFNWIVAEGTGDGERGPRRLAVLVWVSRTGKRTHATLGPALISASDLPSPLGRLLPSWLPILSPFALASDDRPLFMAVLYDLDRPERPLRAVEVEIEHADFDLDTFSAATASGDLQLHQFSTKELPFAIAIKARSRHFDIELYLRPLKDVLTFGAKGAPQLRQGPMVTSYVQRPRLAMTGRIELSDEDGAHETITDFEGDACQDRQWLTVTATQLKWIWLQLRLADGREIMGYVMRDSSAGRWASANTGRRLAREGWLIERDGRQRALSRFDVRSLEDFEERSDRGLCPTRFEVDVPELELRFTLEHILKMPFLRMKAFGPSLDAGIWEGPAHVVESTQALAGHAWVEVMNAATAKLASDR